jgi:hypothetical protein
LDLCTTAECHSDRPTTPFSPGTIQLIALGTDAEPEAELICLCWCFPSHFLTQAVAPEPSVWEVDHFVPCPLPHHYAKDTQAREALEFDIEKHRPVRFVHCMRLYGSSSECADDF